MTLHEQWLRGDFKNLVKKGIINDTAARYFEIYHVYKTYRDQGLGYTDAVLQTGDEMGASERTVKRAISMVSE